MKDLVFRAYSPSTGRRSAPYGVRGDAIARAQAFNQGALTTGGPDDFIVQEGTVLWAQTTGETS